MSLIHQTRARLRLLFRGAADARMDNEFRFHLDMETEKNIRAGMSPDEARRQAAIAFGGAQQHREEMRDERGLAWLGGLSLDLKLGFRMLVKYPGLTIIGGVAMAFAIWVGVVTFEMVKLVVFPTLPLPGGDRIVLLRNWDVAARRAEPRALRDFIVWRDALTSVTDLGAYRDVTRNLIVGDGDPRPVAIAEMTSSAFRIAPARPLLGRLLLASDERAGAPPVVLLGYEVWRTRFSSDANVVGRTVQLGELYATVVGVMPEGFAFPVSHELWMPLKVDVLNYAPREGPAINIFGRLASGVSLDAARAELTTVGRRAAAELPSTHANLQPQVGSYARQFSEAGPADRALMLSINVFAMMLLVLVCGNVALLLFARAATRETELVVRSALGASRGRIIIQLFAEALVLGTLASVVGLAAAQFALRQWGVEFLELNMGRLPFWYHPQPSPMTVLYAIGLTVLAAAIAGVLPALKATRGLGSRLKQGTAGGGGLRFGGVWTAVIISQVAVTVAFPAVAYVEQRELRRIQSADAGFRAAEYLSVYLEMDAATIPVVNADSAWAAHRTRFGTALEALRQRVAAEPGVTGVTFVDRLPRLGHPERRIELDDAAAVGGQGTAKALASQSALREVAIASIDPSYFRILNAPMLAGREFDTRDVASNSRVLIVDQGFVDQVLLGRNAVGRRVRFAQDRASDPSGPWYEIVGVVKELGMGSATQQGRAAGVYLPISLQNASALNMIVHAQGDPMSLGPRVRTIANAVDPTLRPSELQRLSEVTDDVLWVLGLWLRITVLLTAIALLLSLAGVYAVLSFTVARRTREIGVRVALGANPRRVIAAIFRRPLIQVGLGVAAGGVLIIAGALALARAADGGDGSSFSGSAVSLSQVGAIVAYATLMLAVCLLACVVPTRRALSVEPTEALRAE